MSRNKHRKGPIAINRNDWKNRLHERNPEILRLKQSIYPWERFRALVDIYEPGREQIKHQLSHETIVKLVIQHLTFLGFYEAREHLTKESGVDFEQDDMELFKESRLLHFLRSGQKDSEQIYSFALDTHEEIDTKETNELEDLLCALELIRSEQLTNEIDNVNMWDETGDANLIYDNDNQIRLVTLNKLIELLSQDNTEMSFVQMCLVTYESFATPELFFSKLLERFGVPDHVPASETTLIQMKIGNVLRKWIASCSADFSPELVSRLNHFIKELQYNDNKTLSSLSKNLQNAMTKAEKDTSSLKIRQFNQTTPAPKINMKTIFDPKLDLFRINEEEIARQICIIEFALFSRIRPSELLNQSWSKAKYKHRAMNVLRLINRFNIVSMWVTTSILLVTRVKERAKRMAKFIKIAEHLFHTFHNFNATMAILAGLNWSAVHRLSWTRRELPPSATKTLEEIERTLSTDRSFQAYRSYIAGCNPPCIPYLGVYLTDLTFIDENPDTVDGMINFNKRRLVYSVISKIQQYQQTHYNLQPVDQIIQQLLQVKVLDENTMYSISLKREPRKAERHEIM